MRSRSVTRLSWALAILAGLTTLPFLTRPLSPDEGGFLLVAAQWHPGSSLYGHYWVDRPPLLLTVFDAATHLGGPLALRLIGVSAVVMAVLLARQVSVAATDRPTLTPVLLTATFLSTPLFGTKEVNGELLAVPLVLLAMVALIRATRTTSRAAVSWAGAAGVAATSAVLIKQNVIDGFVVAAVMTLLMARTNRLRALTFGASFAVGAVFALSVVLAMGDARGTEPMSLWHALVIFRGHAAVVIHSSASAATRARFDALLRAAAFTGLPVLVAILLIRLRGPVVVESQRDLRLPALAVLAWEGFAVGAGGSYWLHYLIGLVPGLALLAVATSQHPRRLSRTTGAALGLAVGSCLFFLGVAATAAPNLNDAHVAKYLRDHSSPDDTVVVGFGHPNIVYGSGLRSPYSELWSLPVRVRDPQLHRLDSILAGRRAPTWVVVPGPSLSTWGVDARAANATLDARYRPAVSIGSYVVWRRTHDTPASEPTGVSRLALRPVSPASCCPFAACS